MKANRIYPLMLSVCFSLSSLLMALTLAWIVLASSNFLYPVWHDLGGIGDGIDRFGPQNQFKAGFGDTTADQRAELFAKINNAVHKHGVGLEDIRYQTPTSNGEQVMLRQPEVVHLQDVANLIDGLKIVVLINAAFWLLLFYLVYKRPYRTIVWKAQVLGVGACVLVATITVMLIGPVDVFNQLHIWIFPKDHQWFFYYQESLMSTLMMAPTLFAWISAALLIVALIFFVLIIGSAVYFEKTRKARSLTKA